MPFALFHFHCLYLLCFLPLFAAAQTTTKNITLGSSLKAGDGGSSPWLSPSGDFAFGFREVAPGSFLLAIWFNNIPDKTITWSANRDQPAQNGSLLQLTLVGKLVLSDPNGKEIWSASAASAASMLDTGNFELLNQNSVTLWQSFDSPTDTVLPSQTISQGKTLVSHLSTTNYSSGRFSLSTNNVGLVFNTLNWPENSIDYFEYYTIPSQGNGTQVVYNQSGSIYIDGGNGSVIAQVLSKQVSSDQFYQRAVFESDGVFRKYVYPLSKIQSTQGSRNWTMLDFAPQDICSLMTGSDRGGGACGSNSYCQISGDHMPECLCPPGYGFFDQTDKMQGCKPEFDPQSCVQETNQFMLVAMNETNFWGSDYATFENGQSEASCQ